MSINSFNRALRTKENARKLPAHFALDVGHRDFGSYDEEAEVCGVHM